jgi:hypothetical protein
MSRSSFQHQHAWAEPRARGATEEMVKAKIQTSSGGPGRVGRVSSCLLPARSAPEQAVGKSSHCSHVGPLPAAASLSRAHVFVRGEERRSEICYESLVVSCSLMRHPGRRAVH